MTSLHLTSILFTSFWQCSGVIVLQASRICSVSCSFVLGVFAATLMPMIYQRFSIGLRSGLCAGQLIHSKFCLCPLLYQFRSVTGGIAGLEHPPQSLIREEHQGTWHNLTPQWWDLFLSMPSHFTKKPTPGPAMHPHTITDAGCFTLTVRHSGIHSSPIFLLTFDFPV